MLQALRQNSPDWNPQVVDYRLKDVTEKLPRRAPKRPPHPRLLPAPAPAAAPDGKTGPSPRFPAVKAPAPSAPLNVELATPQATTPGSARNWIASKPKTPNCCSI